MMTGEQSSDRRRSGKNNISSVAVTIPARSSIVFDHEDELLKTRYEILKEDHESLEQDYASLKERFKLLEEMNDVMKLHFGNQNRNVELEETNRRLMKDLERERSEKEEYKKMVEEMKRVESESKEMIDDLMKKNEELLLALVREEEEQAKIESKYDELAERFNKVEKECAELKSLCDGQGEENAVTFTKEVVYLYDDHNAKSNTLKDAIVISDESDAENDDLPKENNIIESPVDIKEEEHFNNEPNSHLTSTKAFHPSPSSSSSSSSSSDGYVVVPVKRSRVDES